MFKKGIVFILLAAFLMIPFYADAAGLLSKRDKQLINFPFLEYETKANLVTLRLI